MGIFNKADYSQSQERIQNLGEIERLRAVIEGHNIVVKSKDTEIAVWKERGDRYASFNTDLEKRYADIMKEFLKVFGTTDFTAIKCCKETK